MHTSAKTSKPSTETWGARPAGRWGWTAQQAPRAPGGEASPGPQAPGRPAAQEASRAPGPRDPTPLPAARRRCARPAVVRGRWAPTWLLDAWRPARGRAPLREAGGAGWSRRGAQSAPAAAASGGKTRRGTGGRGGRPAGGGASRAGSWSPRGAGGRGPRRGLRRPARWQGPPPGRRQGPRGSPRPPRPPRPPPGASSRASGPEARRRCSRSWCCR